MKTAIKFYNNTKEDFTHTWDGEAYTFKAGETTMLPNGLAVHFAKHLAVRELNNKKGKEALVNPQNMDPLMKSFIVAGEEVGSESDSKLEVELLNKPKKKAKKVAKKEVKKEEPSEESKFEGLKS